ncbi:MAG: hypothetical protein ACPLUI_14420, partial [Desulfofundulus sp.]
MGGLPGNWEWLFQGTESVCSPWATPRFKKYNLEISVKATGTKGFKRKDLKVFTPKIIARLPENITIMPRKSQSGPFPASIQGVKSMKAALAEIAAAGEKKHTYADYCKLPEVAPYQTCWSLLVSAISKQCASSC